jgi:hypothetical protein
VADLESWHDENPEPWGPGEQQMKSSELFKYDVRVRERMLHKGLINEKDVSSHLAALPDRETACEEVRLEQPGLGRHEPGVARRESNGADSPADFNDNEDET